MKLIFHREAEVELNDAISFYEEREPGLGEELAAEVFFALSNIISYPNAWPLLEEGVRRCLVNRFPYGIIYSPEPEGIFILAVMHLSRHPEAWKTRRPD
jgi:toxin ParE1/3/4